MNISDLINEGEHLVKFHLINEYVVRYAIEEDESDDILASLELTLHRILESGGTTETVMEMLGAIIPTDQDRKELEEFNEYVPLDLGYVLPGLIDFWESKSEMLHDDSKIV